MSLFGAVLATIAVIGVIQIIVGVIGFFDRLHDEFFGLFAAGIALVGLSFLLFFGYAFGTGWTFA